MQGPVILPTDSVITEFYTFSQKMQTLEFDVYECVRICIDALYYAQNYPRSFETDVAMGHENRQVHKMSMEDLDTLNRMMRLLYERLYCAFCAMRLYDATGRLTHPYFELQHGDIIVSDVAFVLPPIT